MAAALGREKREWKPRPGLVDRSLEEIPRTDQHRNTNVE